MPHLPPDKIVAGPVGGIMKSNVVLSMLGTRINTASGALHARKSILQLVNVLSLSCQCRQPATTGSAGSEKRKSPVPAEDQG